MKNENKNKLNLVAILIAIVIIIAISVAIYFLFIRENYESEKSVDEFGKIVGIWKEKPSEEDRNKRKQEIKTKRENLENIIGAATVEDDYLKLKLALKDQENEYYLGYTGDKTINLIITGVGNAIGYNIETNKIDVGDKSIKIDFKLTSAPFDTEIPRFSDYYQNITFADKREIAVCIFNSIEKTIKENYGEDIKIYYSNNDEDIVIDDVNPKIEINKNKAFEPLSY